MLSANHYRSAANLLAILMLVTCMTLLSGCGGDKVADDAAKDAPTIRPEGVKAPAALSALQFMPGSAQIAVGIPPINGVLAKVKTFSDNYGSPDFNPQDVVDQWAAELSTEFGVPGASTFGEIAASKGIDFDAPMAVFLDFRPALEATVAELRRESAAKAETAVPVLQGTEADSAVESLSAPEDVEIPDPEPRWVGVVQASNLDLAKATLQQVALDSSRIPDEPTDTATVGDVEITVYDPNRLAYFVSDQFVVFGDSLDLIREAAGHVAEPVALRYGTKEFPAEARDELVALVYPGRYLDQMASLVNQMPAGDPATELTRKQIASLQSMFGASGPDEPIAASLVWDDDALRASTRLDVERNPGVLAFAGQPTPFRLVSVLPEDTLALLGIRFSDEFKKTTLDLMLPAASMAAADNPGVGLAMSQVNQIVELLGDELALGITKMEFDFPSIYLMLGLKDTEQAKLLLQLFVPSKDIETYREIVIRQPTMNSPLPLNYALASGSLLISNDVDGLKTVIDRLADGKQSMLLDKIGGAFGTGNAYYSALYVDDAIFNDVVMPAADLSGTATPELARQGKQFTDIIDEISMTKGLEGKWLNGQIRIGLKPVAADR